VSCIPSVIAVTCLFVSLIVKGFCDVQIYTSCMFDSNFNCVLYAFILVCILSLELHFVYSQSLSMCGNSKITYEVYDFNCLY